MARVVIDRLTGRTSLLLGGPDMLGGYDHQFANTTIQFNGD